MHNKGRNGRGSGGAKEPVFFFTGGGTGGHVYPGLAVYEALVGKMAGLGLRSHIIWIGSRRGMERQIIESRGIPFIGLVSGKLRRYFSFRNLADVFKVAWGILSAYVITKRMAPVAVFSKGGYVSVPPVIAAGLAGVPVATHESDMDPGLATRINSRFAARIFVAHEQTARFFSPTSREKVLVTGNPVRTDVVAGNADSGRMALSITGDKPILLVLGGSQGARAVNILVWQALAALRKEWHVVHQTGPDESGEPSGEGYDRFEYIREDYPGILAASDLLLCRAGATTLWEIAAAGKPSILLPLGADASRGDQIRNAELFKSIGASYILRTGADVNELLAITGRFRDDPGLIATMAKKAASVYRPGAADAIADEILKLAFGEKVR
jgi:UDP-N-acetylglucosamine--N-acetylmuramyl-(pentapeptide) pyrophosphoryl-undecaprenol N-acetylglucosamine transferase